MTSKDPIQWYDLHAEEVSTQYESVVPEQVHAWLKDLLPSKSVAILDVGAGSGRDASWLAGFGHDVVAVEPSEKMRSLAQQHHAGSSVKWLSDSLPDLKQVFASGLSFDMILLSAVWMHILPSQRTRTFRKLITLLKPGGVLAITLRNGPAEEERCIYPVSMDELEQLARNHGAYIERRIEDKDKLGREDVSWIQVAIRLPDDGTGALPLLRHITLNDDKSSTYKLALLRTLCRIADGTAGYAHDAGEEHVSIPLGLVALYWIRLFKPLLGAGFPQSSINRGYSKLGFVKDAFRKLDHVSHLDLRIGMQFTGERGDALHQTLKDAAETITRMPAHYITFPNGGQVFPVNRIGRFPKPSSIRLDEVYLTSFGQFHVPRNLWRALQRFDVWIEPALVAEWARLMMFYAERQGRTLNNLEVLNTMVWSEPTRDVKIAREQAIRLMAEDKLFCVWSGKRLTEKNIDVDHCFPWAAWPCDDLWNLMPTHRTVNQKEKRAKLPSDQILRGAQDRIITWWESAYPNVSGSILHDRFITEASASLPTIVESRPQSEDIFAAMNLQRMRLKHDQQIPEWIDLR